MNSNSLHKNRTIDVPKGSSAYPNTPSTHLRIMINTQWFENKLVMEENSMITTYYY